MNVIRGRIVSSVPLEIECNGHILSIPNRHCPPATEILLGVRPDDLAVSDAPAHGTWVATVSLVEPAGSFNWVELNWHDVRLRGAAPVEVRLEMGETAFASFPMERIHLFDAASGRRV